MILSAPVPRVVGRTGDLRRHHIEGSEIDIEGSEIDIEGSEGSTDPPLPCAAMSEPSGKDRLVRLRREPPSFRRVTLAGKQALSPRMIRVTLEGDDLEGLVIAEPAASVRLLVPSPGSPQLVMPEWNGNEFLLADGSRPAIRTFTPPFKTANERAIDLDLVLHDGGAASDWAAAAEAGAEAALSGPGRGYDVDADATRFLLVGDETAIPAIRQLLTVLPSGADVVVHVEVAMPEARVDLGASSSIDLTWHDLPAGASPGDTLVAAVEAAALGDGVLVWAAGEAAAVHRIRGHLFGPAGLPRSAATVRGYWKLRE